MAPRGFRVVLRVVQVIFVLGVTACRLFLPVVAYRGRLLPDRHFMFGIRLADACESLGGAFLKLGQLLSSRPDVLNADICRGLARLQMQVESVPFSRIAARRPDASVTRLVTDVEEMAIGSGSIAQVHRGRLRDGACAAIKLRRPGVEN